MTDSNPRGVEHRPAARRSEVKLILLDPNGTPNSADRATATKAVELCDPPARSHKLTRSNARGGRRGPKVASSKKLLSRQIEDHENEGD